MGNQTDKVRFAHVGDLEELGDAACVGHGNPRVIDQVLLHQFVDVPAVAVLFGCRDGYLHLPAQRAIYAGILRADQVLNEVRTQRLDHIAEGHSV